MQHFNLNLFSSEYYTDIHALVHSLHACELFNCEIAKPQKKNAELIANILKFSTKNLLFALSIYQFVWLYLYHILLKSTIVLTIVLKPLVQIIS